MTTEPLVNQDAVTEPPKKRKMRPGGGKAKGNGYEGTIAKQLTKALQPLNFIRTPGSGARVGGKNFETIGQMFGEDALKIFVGDVVPVNEKKEGLRFAFSIECKFYSTPDSFTALFSGSSNIYSWFEEAVVDAAKIGKTPMLVWKWNRTPSFAALDAECDMAKRILLNSTIDPPFMIKAGSKRALIIYELDKLLTVKGWWSENAR